MTDVASTPPALRWVALFLAACAVLGLFLGFRDQIRKNPPGWYTGAEQIATPLPATTQDAREAVAFDPSAAPATPAAAPTQKATETRAVTPVEADAKTETAAAEPAAPKIAPPVLPPTPTPTTALKARTPPPAPKAAPSPDPVGDILEGQKQAQTPDAVPY